MDNPEEQDKRIQKIVKTLKSLLKKQNIQPNKLKTAEGIIQRVAFMQVELEDLETDIKAKGVTEQFSQTKDIKYTRERPASAIYTKQIKNYTSACKQLFDLLPSETTKEIPTEGNKLLKFVAAGAGGGK